MTAFGDRDLHSQFPSHLVLVWYYHVMNGEMVFLGIDGGGSKCRARVRSAAGHVLSEAVGGASNIYQDFTGALATIVDTAKEAARQAGVATDTMHAGMGLAGIVTSVGAEKISEAKLPFASVTADNDAYAACMGAFSGSDGGIVIAGTGSIGFALVGGQRHMVGGWGFQLGDHGSGAWVGHHAVRRAALALDGLLQPTGSSKTSSNAPGGRASTCRAGRNARCRRTMRNSPPSSSNAPARAMCRG